MARSRAVRRFALAGLLGRGRCWSVGCSLGGSAAVRLARGHHAAGGADAVLLVRPRSSPRCVVGVVVWGLMFWAFIVYRKRKNGPLYPKQTKENLPLELDLHRRPVPDGRRAVLLHGHHRGLRPRDSSRTRTCTVDVTAFKWNWDFGYPGTSAPGRRRGAHDRQQRGGADPGAAGEPGDPVRARVARTSSTRSGRSTSCSSATSSPTRRRTRPRTSSRTRSSRPAPSSAAARSSAARTTAR